MRKMLRKVSVLTCAHVVLHIGHVLAQSKSGTQLQSTSDLRSSARCLNSECKAGSHHWGHFGKTPSSSHKLDFFAMPGLAATP